MSTKSLVERLQTSIDRDFDSTVLVQKTYKIAVIAILLGLVGVPLGFFLWGAVWSTTPGLGGHFTLDAFSELLKGAVYQSVINTLIVATFGTLIAVSVGVAAAVFVGKTDLPLKPVFTSIFLVQYLMPPFVIAYGWEFYAQGSDSLIGIAFDLIGLGVTPSVYNLFGMVLVSGLYYSGFVYLLTVSAIGSVPSELEEAARMSGAKTMTIVHQIIIKLTLPAIMISAILVFTRLAQSFGIPLILGLPRRVYVIATRMYIALTAGYPPNFAFAAALGVVLLVLALIMVGIQSRITGAAEKYEVIGSGSGSSRSETLSLGTYRYAISGFLTLVLVVFYILPVLVILVSSLQPTFVGFDAPLSLTTKHYLTLFVGRYARDFWAATINTLFMSTFGAFVSMFLASLVSYIIIKSEPPLSTITNLLALSPITMPSIVVGMSFLWLFLTYDFLGLYYTLWIIILALVSRFIVIGTRVSNSSFRAIDSILEEAAEINGANLLTILRQVYWPLIKPGFLSGFALLTIIYMKVLSIPLLLQGGTENLVYAVMLFQVRQAGYGEVASAIAVIMMVLIGGGYLLLNLLADVDLTRVGAS